MEQDVLRGVLRLPYENADFAQVVWLTRAELVPPPPSTHHLIWKPQLAHRAISFFPNPESYVSRDFTIAHGIKSLYQIAHSMVSTG